MKTPILAGTTGDLVEDACFQSRLNSRHPESLLLWFSASWSMGRMDYRPLLAQHALPLTHEVDEWNKAAHATGLKAYECKASYICGAMREFMQASGLNLANEYHLGALFLALDATELLGRVVSGTRRPTSSRRKGPREPSLTEVLRRGVKYVGDHADPQVRSLPHTPQDYAKLRNFAGHGATYLAKGVNFDPDSTRLLLRHLSHTLNTMWDDRAVPTKLAAVEIHPVYSEKNGIRQLVYVQEIQDHLKENGPGDRLRDNDWQNQPDNIVSIDNSSPPVTGAG
ncbi:hypothetical protein [Streptomyces sp. NPDC101776]|uniref:hypothetical protein n=1 Tax=Streptomyces sp. NPDC101776 TaxID=3366146 RepID=UPI003801DC22